jgi:putative ABC transport system permease protein
MLGEIEIVGVVSDVRHAGLASKYESEIYLPYGRPATAEMHVVVQSDLETAAVARAVSDVLLEMDPELAPSRVAAISDLLWESVARPRFNTALLTGLALAAALLAVVGTYGIIAYSVSQRRGEIGLRMALGADSAATVAMMLREALGIVAAGAILGVLGALGATSFMSALLFDVEPTDPLTYGIVLAGSIAIGTLAAWTSARRATRVDPVVALRAQ